jgi:Ca2+-binding RTX toxin-like protein
MTRIIRAAIALALAAGFVVATAPADAAPHTEGASQSLFVVDVIVRGTPPPGATIDVLTPDATIDGDIPHTVTLADAGANPDIVTEVGTVARHLFVDPENDAGADAIAYTCQMTGNGTSPDPSSFCEIRTTPDATAPTTHVYAEYWGNVNQIAVVTITLTFGTCNGRPVTVFSGAGDAATSGADVILGTSGADTINGLGGADQICGLGGADRINGGNGSDIVNGGMGADVLDGGANPDYLVGAAGTDALFGQGGADVLDGGTESDYCDGGTETDTGSNCETTANLP